MFELLLISFRLFVSFIAALLSLKCKGTREYVLELPPSPLARVPRQLHSSGPAVAISGTKATGSGTQAAVGGFDLPLIATDGPPVVHHLQTM